VLNLQHRSWDIDLPRDAPTIGGKQGHAKACAGQALLTVRSVKGCPIAGPIRDGHLFLVLIAFPRV
jgi:hypothetical protein